MTSYFGFLWLSIWLWLCTKELYIIICIIHSKTNLAVYSQHPSKLSILLSKKNLNIGSWCQMCLREDKLIG